MLITSPKVCELVGCSFRQLDHWERLGIIKCDRPATGVGSSRGWTLEQAALVRACFRLAERGAGTKTLRAFARAVGRSPELWNSRVVVDGDGKVTSTLRGADDGWLIDLAACRRWVADAYEVQLAQVS